jgi:hypothetical protein
MALNVNTRVSTRATVASAGTSVAAGTAVPDNCHTIIFLNRSGNIVLIGNGAAGGTLADDGTSTPLPGNASLTWEIGVMRTRPSTLVDLIYDSIGGAANVDITYLCSIRSTRS